MERDREGLKGSRILTALLTRAEPVARRVMPSPSRAHEEGAAQAYLEGTSSSAPTRLPGAGRQRATQQGSDQVGSPIRTRAARPRRRVRALAVLAIAGVTTAGCSDRHRPAGAVFTSSDIASTTTCQPAGGTAPVAAPVFVRNIAVGETGWFSSPAIVDLAHDGKRELVAPFYSTFVFAADGKELARATAT